MLGVWLQISEHSGAAADRMIDRLHELFHQLEVFPFMGEVHPHPTKALRRITVRPYVVVYQATADEVTILRIIHAAQRWEDML